MEKGIIIVDKLMPTGLKANICAVLEMTLGKSNPEIVGADLLTKDQKPISGITQIPLPILQSSSDRLGEIFLENQSADLLLVVFDESALTTKTYPDFQEKLSSVHSSQLRIHGLLAYGPRKVINKISAELPLLK
ncbi:hypothetical protein BVER_02701 [Candidatus Burkholderia verschuerenii]|uniref:DUF2000 domain-containing protein n=1 Tax=Candidatus Burkholderia verschuerenii TaxID=242163 RepID=A0A0L0M4Q2_9BURK|nr:DUF2000 domain-containing protein [Candidatus Burkholderia verschuerenii]KND57271.1 hypothetical protein BVER_02701 [Candidatus Burkholderia verschuerenii]